MCVRVCVCVRVPVLSCSWLRRLAVSGIPLAMVSTCGRACISNRFILIVRFVCLFFVFFLNLFARYKNTHFSTGQYKIVPCQPILPAEHSLCEGVTVLPRQVMEGTAVKKIVRFV
jgi:hypothetical protein